MERLTEKCWRNLDPWECCGQDRFCGRGCHDLGGCTNGCIVPKLYARLADYEDTGLEPETVCDLLERFNSLYAIFDNLDLVDRVHFQAFLERVRRWYQAEKDGRLVVLPCKVGSTVYVITSPANIDGLENEETIDIFECTVESVTFYSNGSAQFRLYYHGVFVASFVTVDDFGKTVFLDLEEAEAALKKREETT